MPAPQRGGSDDPRKSYYDPRSSPARGPHNGMTTQFVREIEAWDMSVRIAFDRDRMTQPKAVPQIP